MQRQPTTEQSTPNTGRRAVLGGTMMMVVVMVVVSIFYTRDPVESNPIEGIAPQTVGAAERQESSHTDPPRVLERPESSPPVAEPKQKAVVDKQLDILSVPGLADFAKLQHKGALKPRKKSKRAYVTRLTTSKIKPLTSHSAVSAQTTKQAPSEVDVFNERVIQDLTDMLGVGGQREQRIAAVENLSPTDSYVIPNLSRDRLEATFLEQMEFTLLESTIIPIVIDQAINSQLPGRLRATVSDNIWSADGVRILIPRGTRAMGEYLSSIRHGQSRIFVIWSRLLDPYGLDIPIASGTTDQMGMSGLTGQLDSHFARRFGSAALISLIGGLAQAQTKNDNQRKQIAEDFNSAATLALENSINMPPTITSKAAAAATIYVNQDINFYQAYQLGLSKKQQRQQAKARYISRAQQAMYDKALSAQNRNSLTRLHQVVKQAHPAPLAMGKLPRSMPAARRASEQQIASGFKTKLELARRLAKVKIDSTTGHNSCPDYFVMTAGRLLSVLVQDYLLACGYSLNTWLAAKNGLVMDWQFTESADILMPNAASSLAVLLVQYAIVLAPESPNSKRYRVYANSTSTLSIQKN